MNQGEKKILDIILDKNPYLSGEDFYRAGDGTHYSVFLSKNYVIRARREGQEILFREAELLQQLNLSLVPKVIQVEQEESFAFMVENRLPGSNINLIWKDLKEEKHEKIAKNIVDSLEIIHQETGSYFYDVQRGKSYRNLFSALSDEAEENIEIIEKTDQANDFLADIKKGIADEQAKEKLEKIKDPLLVHGDMIIHNLLTDGEQLTGVIDWELARWGDPDQDLARLVYYHECARGYFEQGQDESFEYDFLNKLLSKIETKINTEDFRIKYRYYRSLFYLKALAWAIRSDKPEENIEELKHNWENKSGL
jgi:aminoglycoside phosphotransferase (APT) family kinase protein